MQTKDQINQSGVIFGKNKKNIKPITKIMYKNNGNTKINDFNSLLDSCYDVNKITEEQYDIFLNDLNKELNNEKEEKDSNNEENNIKYNRKK